MSDEQFARGRVVCMVRGGEAGRDAQGEAIRYALSFDCELLFVHVVDSEALPLSNEALRQPAKDELAWLGRVILAMAQRRAQRAGVRAETLILFGTLFAEMQALVKRLPIQRIYVGAPHPAAADYPDRLERVQTFAERLSLATGVPVVLAQTPGG